MLFSIVDICCSVLDALQAHDIESNHNRPAMHAKGYVCVLNIQDTEKLQILGHQKSFVTESSFQLVPSEKNQS